VVAGVLFSQIDFQNQKQAFSQNSSSYPSAKSVINQENLFSRLSMQLKCRRTGIITHFTLFLALFFDLAPLGPFGIKVIRFFGFDCRKPQVMWIQKVVDVSLIRVKKLQSEIEFCC